MLSYSTQDHEPRDKYHPLENHKEGRVYCGSRFQDTMYHSGKAGRQEHEATATLYLKLESRSRPMLVLSSFSLFHLIQEGLWPIGWCQPQYQLNLPSEVYLPGSTLRKIQLWISYVILNPGNLTMRASHDGCSRRLNQWVALVEKLQL